MWHDDAQQVELPLREPECFGAVSTGTSLRYTGTSRDGSSSANPAPLFSSCTVQQVLIIGPDDGMPLAEELRYTQLPAGQQWSAPDGLFSYEIFGTPYWTNRDRPLP